MSGEATTVAIQLTPRRFSAAEYHHMIEAGVFGQDERLELIDGEIVQTSPIGDRHAACVRRLIALLSRYLRIERSSTPRIPSSPTSRMYPNPMWRSCA